MLVASLIVMGLATFVIGLLFVLVAFGVGYLAGWGDDALEDIGGLATAQRNTAAAMLIAVSSFTDPTVFVLITLVNTLGIALLIAIAKLLKGAPGASRAIVDAEDVVRDCLDSCPAPPVRLPDEAQ